MMATMPDPIKVEVERAVHDGLRELIQAIEVKHGLRVNVVQVEWIDASSVHEPRFLIADITISTTSAAGGGS
jgi:hypothetical protein